MPMKLHDTNIHVDLLHFLLNLLLRRLKQQPLSLMQSRSFATKAVCQQFYSRPDSFSVHVMFSVSISLLDLLYNLCKHLPTLFINVAAFSRPSIGPVQ